MPPRVDVRRRLLSGFSGKVLDVGCGRAEESMRLAAENKCEVWCVDTERELLLDARKAARRLGVSNKVEFIQADANSLNFVSSSFDAVMFKSALHHLSEWRAVLGRVRVWLRDGGVVYLEEPLRTNYLASAMVRLYYAIPGPVLRVHEQRDPNQWPFDPSHLVREVRSRFLVQHLSYHQFVGLLVIRAVSYAKTPAAKAFFQALSRPLTKLDSYFESNARLQRYCSMIVMEGRKTH